MRDRRPGRALAALRRLTVAAYALGRGRRVVRGVCEPIARYYARTPRRLIIDDYDGDLTVAVDLTDHIGSHVFWSGGYATSELAVVAHHLQPDHVFLDVGANIGLFTLFAAKRARQVHAFEPMSSLFSELEWNVAANRLSNVHAHRLALSDHAGAMTIYVPNQRYRDGTFNRSMATLVAPSADEARAWHDAETVPLVTLDQFVVEQGICRIDLMKIDVEGAELDVLRGGRDALARFRPALIVEASQQTSQRAGVDARMLAAYLRDDLGYQVHIIQSGGRLSPPGERLRRWQNLFCVPAS